MSAIKEIGNKYNRLTVISHAGTRDKKAMWNCVCDCGNTKIVSGTHLRTNHVQSCGCYRTEMITKLGKSNKGKSDNRGQPRKYEQYEGVLGKVIGAVDRSEHNGAVMYVVECAKCGEQHTRNAKHLKQGQETQDCSYYKPPNWSGLERDDNMMRKKYGISTAEFAALLEFQGNCCAICAKPIEALRRRINIDHDHTTNQVRGILCTSCNTGLGHLGDDMAGLQKAMAYLQNQPFNQFKNALAR
jgi:hypothetical protein